MIGDKCARLERRYYIESVFPVISLGNENCRVSWLKIWCRPTSLLLLGKGLKSLFPRPHHSPNKHTQTRAKFWGIIRDTQFDDNNVFNFQSTRLDPPPRRRGWDRIPKSPFGPRHQGRKLWKRYDTRSWKAAAICGLGDDVPALKLDDTETSAPEKAIKRLRVKQLPSSCAKGDDGELSARYVTTLRDDAPGTPKS